MQSCGPPTPAEVNALLAAVGDQPLLWCLLRLAATTGARRGQLLALRWRDIDLGRATVAFTRALVMGPDGPVLAATKTDATHCTDLDDDTAAGLRRCRAAAVQQATDAGVSLSAGAFVFSDDVDGRRPWLPDKATRQFIAARRTAGLAHFRLHDLRHFMATEMQFRGRGTAGHGLPAAQPRPHLHHGQRLHPRHPGGGPARRRETRPHPRSRRGDAVARSVLHPETADALQ